MAAAEALDADEQKLFDEMKGDTEAPPKEDEQKVEAKGDDKPKEEKALPEKEAKKDSVVPKAALDQARIENKELRKELDQMKSMLAEGDRKLKQILENAEKKADAGPNFSDDPAGHLKHENEQLKKALDEVNKKLEQQDKAAEQTSQVQKHAAFVQSREREFAKEHPDYFKAAEYVAAVWRDEFAEAGYDEGNLSAMVFQKSLAITSQAIQREKDPAEAIYKIAKRYGFTAEQPKEEKKEKADEKKGESKLEQIRKGQELAKTSGGDGPDDLTITSLANMTDDQMEKVINDKDWWSKNIRGKAALH